MLRELRRGARLRWAERGSGFGATGAAGLVVACMMGLASCEKKAAQSTGEGAGQETKVSGERKIVVGFSQIGAESAWRTAETTSIKSEAEKRGITLKFSDAQGDQENQVRALRTFIQQKVNYIVLAPKTEDGWQQVLEEAKGANIPVILVDRAVSVEDESLFVTFIGSDFVEEGRRAGAWLAAKTGGQAMVAELQGTPGAGPAIDRKKGFEEAIAKHPGMRIVKSQSGQFERAKGREVFEAMLRSPEGNSITALYSHNDDMALGAIQAIEAAGKKPGQDIVIVSIDGIRDAFAAILEGTMNCTVECSPLLGPAVFDTIAALERGESVARWIKTEEGVYAEGAVTAEILASRQY